MHRWFVVFRRQMPVIGRKRMGFCPDCLKLIHQDLCAADYILVVRLEPKGDLIRCKRLLDKSLHAEDLGGMSICGDRFCHFACSLADIADFKEYLRVVLFRFGCLQEHVPG